MVVYLLSKDFIRILPNIHKELLNIEIGKQWDVVVSR